MKKTTCVLTILLVLVSVKACHRSEPETPEPTVARPAVTATTVPTEPAAVPTTIATEPAPTEAPAVPPTTLPPTEPTAALVNGMRPEFQKAMDSYESFMDDYVKFMTEYSQSDNALLMLAKYGEFMTKYADFTEKFEAWEGEDLNTAELNYYIAVQSRVSQKLLTAAASIPG